MAKRPLEQEQNGARAGEELEELKQALRDRAVAMGERERELDRIERKLALRERRLGRRMRPHRPRPRQPMRLTARQSALSKDFP